MIKTGLNHSRILLVVIFILLAILVSLSIQPIVADSNIDTIPPTVIPPPNQLIITNNNSANVTFPSPTATDNVGVTSGPTCSTPQGPVTSGYLWTVGTWIVTCTASDAAGNVGSANFTISVQPQSQSSPADINNKVTVFTSFRGPKLNQQQFLVNEPLYFESRISSLNYFSHQCTIHLKIYDSSNILVSDQNSFCDLSRGYTFPDGDSVSITWQPTTPGAFTARMSITDNTPTQNQLALPWSIPFVVAGIQPIPSFPIAVSTDKSSYKSGDMIVITGHVTNVQNSSQVTIQIFDPSKILGDILIPPISSDGSFTTSVPGEWKNTGTYTIMAYNGQYGKGNTTFNYIGQTSPPTAKVGPDQTVNANDTVTLDGSASIDPYYDAVQKQWTPSSGTLPPISSYLKYSWTQTGGIPVTFSSKTVANPTFIAPLTPSGMILSFTLTVTDQGSNTSTPVTITVQPLSTLTNDTNHTYQIPNWIHNNAKWWHDGSIGDEDFEKGIQYMIQQKIMKIPQTTSGNGTSNHVPTWVKNNAGFWGTGQITDDEFVKGIQYLIQQGIIKV